MNGHSSGLAEELVMSRFICILEPPPPADVINQNGFVSGVPTYHVMQKLTQTIATFKNNPASGSVRICLDNGESVAICVGLYPEALVVE
jgi:hypothetical protein